MESNIDRSEYALLNLESVHTFQVHIDDTEPRPETTTFVIFAQDDSGQKVAISIPFSQLGDLPKAIAAASMQFPEGRRLQ